MDDSVNEDEALETNWVFVEDVDVAEEALNLNSNTVPSLHVDTEFSNNSSETQSKQTIKGISDSQIPNGDENFSKDDTQIIELDSESDGISIISNWSNSHGTAESDNLEDVIEDKDLDGNPSGANGEIEDIDIESIDSAIGTFNATFNDEVGEIPNENNDQHSANDSQEVLEDDNYKHEEEIKGSLDSYIEGFEKEEEDFHNNYEVFNILYSFLTIY